jgi:hypothetical protein
MQIKKITFEHRLDFHAVMGCEHCGAEAENRSGYNDHFYMQEVIPAMHCGVCGLNRKGELRELA